MVEGGKKFSSSEELARSLEPKYSVREQAVVDRLHHTAFTPEQPKPPESVHKPAEPKRSLKEQLLNQPLSKRSAAPQEHPHPHHVHHRRKRFEVFAAIFLFLLLVLVMLLSASTQSTAFVVLIGFLPTIFTVVVAMVVYEASRDNKNMLWVLPLLLVSGFYWLGQTHSSMFGSLDIDVLSALNLVISFVYLIINYFLLQRRLPRERPQVKVVVQEREIVKEVIPEDLSKFIASIEDKSKALNFVIGRVYNAYHGGTKELRSLINMKQEWYDQFSQIPADPEKVDFFALKRLIASIEERLGLLEKSEKEVFGPEHEGFKHLVRESDGSDTIIDVLDKNDKDPVKTYVEGALQFCGKVKDFIAKRQTPEVKNEYVSRPDEEKKPAPRSSSWDKDHQFVKE